MVHLAIFVRKLSGSVSRIFVDQDGWLHFEVACLIGFVEKKVDEGPLQFGALSFVERKSGTGYFVAVFKIDDVVFRDQIPVRKGPVGHVFGLAPGFHHFIFFRRFSFRNRIVGHIGQHDHRLVKSFFAGR